jgi:hypothetical protein
MLAWRSLSAMADPSEPFGLFVSSVPGKPVARFGASRVLIGAARRFDGSNGINYFPEQIVAIPYAELRRYRREYQRAIANGSLRARTGDEWRASQAPQLKAKQARATTTLASNPSEVGAPPVKRQDKRDDHPESGSE